MTTNEVIKHGLSLAALLGGAALAYAFGDTHAGAYALGAVSMYIVPMVAPAVPRAAVAGLVVGAMALGASGCAELAAAGTVGSTVAHVTCAVVDKAHAICESLGLSPDEPCPQAEAVLANVDLATGAGAPKGCDW